jgi:transposase-like protein
MEQDRQSLVPPLEASPDPVAVLIREAIREVLETAVAEEVTAALGRGPWERVAERRGYRHGTSARMLVTGEGPVTLAVPRARLRQSDGTTREWQNGVLPRYARRQVAVDAILAQLYVSGASTRDLRRALQPLLGTRALSRSAVSRVVTRLQVAYRAWRTRPLGAEPIAFLYLDGQRVRVRADRGVTTAVVLMALGVRPSGEKVVLALRLVSDETTAAWRTLLEDLTSRGLARPELVISDGSQGAQAALDLTWPGVPHQRCLVHKLRNLLAVTPRPLQGALIADFRRFAEATNPAAVHAGVAHFRRTWTTRWSAAVVCLDEAGAQLISYTALPPALWKGLRSTNIIERVFGEFRRRLKVQGALPTSEAVLTVLWGTLATGAIQLRRVPGYRTIALAPAQAA